MEASQRLWRSYKTLLQMIVIDLQTCLYASVTSEQSCDYCRGRVGGGDGDVEVLSNRTVSGAIAVSGSVAASNRRPAARSRQRRGERAGGPEPKHVPTAPTSSAPAPAAPADAATTRSAAVVSVVTVVNATTPGPAELAESAPEL